MYRFSLFSSLFHRLKICTLCLTLIFSHLTTVCYATTTCSDLEIIFARGSGAPIYQSADFLAFQDALSHHLDSNFQNLTTHFYDLGAGTDYDLGATYPAVNIEDPTVLASAYLHLTELNPAYDQSIEAGITELELYLLRMHTACPQTHYVLAGYSQGAQVISTAINRSAIISQISPYIIYAATFGDPKLYLPEGHQANPLSRPDACLGRNLSNYRINVPDCYTYHGILGATMPYQNRQFINKLGVWCNQDDPICGSSLDLSGLSEQLTYEGSNNPFLGLLRQHLAYKTDGSYTEAAQYIAAAVAVPYAAKLSPSSALQITAAPAPHDAAILIDTTGSMHSLISQYRTEALHLAQQVLDTGGRVALYEYRDLSDPFLPHQLCDFSCTLSEFNDQLQHLTTINGGDASESALNASLQVMDELKWQKGAQKSIILLTDAGYLDPDRDGTTRAQVIQRSLEIDPVNFYVITCVDDVTDWLDLALPTGGNVFHSSTDLPLSTDYIFNRPTARLPQISYQGAVNDTITFDATASTGQGDLNYAWDLDADGIFELNTTTPTTTYTYSAPLSGYIQVKVTDSHGYASTMSASIIITNDLPPTAQYQLTPFSHGQITTTSPATTTYSPKLRAPRAGRK